MELKRPENYFIKKLLNEVKLKDIMTTAVISIREDEPFHRVEEKLKSHRIRHLPVVDVNNRLVGLITQRDLYKIQSPRKLEDGTWYYDRQMLDNFILKHVMAKAVCTLSSEASVAEALLKMVDTKYGCIPIVDDKNMLCGIITQIDILKIAARILRE